MTFLQRLKESNQPSQGRRWVYVPYDQLTCEVGPLAESSPQDLGIILIESRGKAKRRPYHQQKLALVLANQRHFALEQAARGISIRYMFTPEVDEPYARALTELAKELGTITMMEATERELRTELAPVVDAGSNSCPMLPTLHMMPTSMRARYAAAARSLVGAWKRSTDGCASAAVC